MEQEIAMRSLHFTDLHYHTVFSFEFTLHYFTSSDGDLFRSIIFILVFSFIVWSNSQNPMRDDDSINITCYILIIHIIFQRSLTCGGTNRNKNRNTKFSCMILREPSYIHWLVKCVSPLSSSVCLSLNMVLLVMWDMVSISLVEIRVK